MGFNAETEGRVARAEISVYDAMLAEVLGERLTEKAMNRKHYNAEMYAKAQSQKYRNRSGKKREELPKCNLRGHDADRGYWRDWKAYCTMQSHSMRKHREAERNIRSDWERDLAALEWDIRYTEWDTRNLRDDICELNADIQCLEYQLSDVELLRDRLENLRKNRDLSEKYLRNSEEFLRKYMWVKEML